MIWTIDVWHITLDARGNARHDTRDWRRFRIATDDPTEAELIACQWSGTEHGMAVGSVVIDPV